MDPNYINNYKDLTSYIRELKIQKFHQEATINADIEELSKSLNPASLIKTTVGEIIPPAQKQSHTIPRAGLNMGANFLIDQVWGRHHSVKSFLSAMIVRKISDIAINNPAIYYFIKSKFNKKDKK